MTKANTMYLHELIKTARELGFNFDRLLQMTLYELRELVDEYI